MNVSVCLTNFGRPMLLKRAIDSALAAGFKDISVSAMKHPTDDVEPILAGYNGALTVARNIDLGCQTSWLIAAYYARTPYVILLHDDDQLCWPLGAVMQKKILPALNSGVGFASWRARLRFEDGTTRETEYMRKPTGVWNSSEIEKFVLRPRRLSLSPIVSVFNREVLIHAIKECETVITDYLHPGMALGSEVLVYLRHCSTFPKWQFIDEQLSEYGAHSGSGTVQYQNSGNLTRLTKGYDAVRLYYTAHKNMPITYPPRILLLSVPFQSNDADEQQRFDNARRTWEFHFNQGTMLDFPIMEGMLKRSSKDLGDTAWVPYLKDVIDYGVAHALGEDVISYANLDLGFTTLLPEQVCAIVNEHGVCVGWRRTMAFNADHPLRTCKNGLRDGGCDFFAVSKKWWKANRDKLPDMFLAANHWDFCFRVYAERATNGKCYLYDHTIHAPHDSFFSRHKMDNVRQRHNHAVTRKFFQSIGDNKIVQTIDKGQLRG